MCIAFQPFHSGLVLCPVLLSPAALVSYRPCLLFPAESKLHTSCCIILHAPDLWFDGPYVHRHNSTLVWGSLTSNDLVPLLLTNFCFCCCFFWSLNSQLTYFVLIMSWVVYSLHSLIPRPFPLPNAYWKQSKTGIGNGLGTRLLIREVSPIWFN